MKPNTEGCTEWSCLYHGGDNRFKAAHFEGCPIRATSRPVFAEAEDPDGARCTCWLAWDAEDDELLEAEREAWGEDEHDDQWEGPDDYDAWDEPWDVREGWPE